MENKRQNTTKLSHTSASLAPDHSQTKFTVNMTNALNKKKQLEDAFSANLKDWVFDRSNPNSPRLNQELQNILLNGYRRIVNFAEEVGRLQQKEAGLPDQDKKYTLCKPDGSFSELSTRIKIRMAVEGNAFSDEILEALNAQNIAKPKFGIWVAPPLMGSVIKAAAIDAVALGYISNHRLIDPPHLSMLGGDLKIPTDMVQNLIKETRSAENSHTR